MQAAYENVLEEHNNDNIESDSTVESDVDSILSDPSDSDLTTTEVEELYWMKNARSLRRGESSYLDGRIGRSTRNLATIDYVRCTFKELKRFIHARGAKDPFPGLVVQKYYYLRVLAKADRDWRFRFLDLPAEIRLLVYQELLFFNYKDFSLDHFDNERKSITPVLPAILRTCKDIHREATPVLYDDNEFSVGFKAHDKSHHSAEPFEEIWAHTDVEFGQGHRTRHIRMPESINNFPDFLRRISRLKITCTYKAGDAAKGQWMCSAINHFLYALASFLMEGHCLKNVHLELGLMPEASSQACFRILYPLRRLRSVPNLFITGAVPKGIESKLRKDLSGDRPVLNTLRQWQILAAEGEEAEDAIWTQTRDSLAIQNSVNADYQPWCDCDGCMPLPWLCNVRSALRALDQAGKPGCLSRQHEENLGWYIHGLRLALRRVQHEKLQTVNGFAKKRESALKFETEDVEEQEEQYSRVLNKIESGGDGWSDCEEAAD